TQEKKQEQQKKLNDWRSEAFNIVHDTLKTVQNTLFDLTLGYNSTYLTTFNEIISTINTMPELPPPLVPTRSSSFITEQAPTPPLTWENRLKKKVVEAKDYAAKSLSPIAERLKKITISEEGTQEKISKKDTSYESIESTHPSQYHIAPKNPSKKIKKIVHDIYNSTKQSAALMSITTESQSLLACAQFVKIPNLFTKSNPFVLDSLQKTAKLIGHMLVTNAQQSVNLRENFFSIKKNLYDAIVLLPNLLYTTILTKRIAWIGHETNQYYTQSSTMLHHLLQPTPLHSTSLSTQEQHEAILYMHTFLKQQKLTNVESILSGYILLRSIGIITSPYKKNLAATQDLISQATLNIVTETKEAILVFLKNSLYTGLQSPFPVTQDLFTHIFIQLNRLYKLEPLILLLKETRTDELALGVKKHYEQIDLAIHAINNAFAICKTAAKKRAENEQFLTTASLLHETLEHSLTLIKSFMPNLP
ncbi:MAG TPA: hypothetical protein VL201_00420, partial [Patescibacteria group bacterium]|nr:hypothetical protein [Patescibacteria group bacterium]